MRFDSIHAFAFGPFRDASLELAPGMNVVCGANEAGKSTWHSAIYAGLCGMRRGRGRPAQADLDFEERHRPWDNGAWEVGALVELADGRRVVLRHDLAGKVDNSARDADIAEEDYSNEILFDGSPDGARWLGLNRTSFLHTACVRQSQMLSVREGADAMQEALQAAADTASRDATAARALDLLNDYRRDRLGSERATTKPLARSRAEVGDAKRVLSHAWKARAEYERRREESRKFEETQRDSRARLEAAKARLLVARADESRKRLDRVRSLAGRFVGGPPRHLDDHDVADGVADAVAAWRARPQPQDLVGESLAEIEGRREALEVEAEALGSETRRGSWILLVMGIASVGAGVGAGLAGHVLIGVILTALGLGTLWWWGWGAARSEIVRRTASLDTRRKVLAEAASHRRHPEEVFERDTRRLADAETSVCAAADAAGVAGNAPDALYEDLVAWQRDRRERLKQLEAELEAWDTLQQLRGGHTVEDLETDTERLAERAEAAVAAVDSALLEGEETAPVAIQELEAQEEKARDRFREARGSSRELARSLPVLADAEDQLADAERRLERLERLDATLERTIAFLARAEERVHRDIAQVLRETLREWLPRVTGGRYTDCRVNPGTLGVEVRGPDGRFRAAGRLSHGTAEQVYLLLRLALARHLTLSDEDCPLILDDALSGCDSRRTRAVLDTLLAIADATQVVLFTHHDDVRDWAQERLTEPRHRVTLLDVVEKP